MRQQQEGTKGEKQMQKRKTGENPREKSGPRCGGVVRAVRQVGPVSARLRRARGFALY